METILQTVKTLFDKVSTYQLFNYLFPGAVLLFILELCYKGEGQQNFSVWEKLFLCYTVGMAVSRVGTHLFEDLFERVGLFQRTDYKEIIKAELKDSKVNMLLQVSNTYRTMAAVFLVLVIIMLINKCHCLGFVFASWLVWLSIGLVILFIFSFRKQYNYAGNRAKFVNTSEYKEEVRTMRGNA